MLFVCFAFFYNCFETEILNNMIYIKLSNFKYKCKYKTKREYFVSVVPI